jgi:hypothetical protein
MAANLADRIAVLPCRAKVFLPVFNISPPVFEHGLLRGVTDKPRRSWMGAR